MGSGEGQQIFTEPEKLQKRKRKFKTLDCQVMAQLENQKVFMSILNQFLIFYNDRANGIYNLTQIYLVRNRITTQLNSPG